MERQELCMGSDSPKNKTKAQSPNAASHNPYQEESNACRMKRASNKNIESVNVESIAACKMEP